MAVSSARCGFNAAIHERVLGASERLYPQGAELEGPYR